MEQVYNILEQIKNTNSRIEKETLLKNNANNELLQNVLRFLYDTNIITGLKKGKLTKVKNNKHTIEFINVLAVIEYLKQNNTGTDEVIANVQNFISRQPEHMYSFYVELFTKTYKIGVTAKTLNKVFGDSFIANESGIRFTEPMLAKNYWQEIDSFNDENIIITTKLDGERNLLVKKDGKIINLSRKGKIVTGLIDIEKDAELLPDNYVYDGELLAVNDEGLCSKELFKKTSSIMQTKGNKTGLIFHVFDMVPLDEFEKGQSKLDCYNRKIVVKQLLQTLDLSWIKEVSMLYIGKHDKRIVQKYLDEAIIQGNEGIMINTYSGKYKCKRCSELFKVKKMQDCDVRVIGVEESKVRKGEFGRINVNYKGNIVGVGSGFSKEEKIAIWNNPEQYIGKIAKIKYFEETCNKNGKTSLRFPIFERFRYDKTEESYY